MLCLGAIAFTKGFVSLYVLGTNKKSTNNLKRGAGGSEKSPDENVNRDSLSGSRLLKRPRYRASEKKKLWSFLNEKILKKEVDFTPEEVKQASRKVGLELIESRDENPATGTILFMQGFGEDVDIVSITSQFEGDSGSLGMTHLAMVLNPGQKSRSLLKAIQKKFSRPPDKKFENANLQAWRLKNGYVFWVQRLGEKEIVNDPVLAISNAKTGAI